MYLSRLHIHHVRNLIQADLCFHPRFNLFVGHNAQGKTSVLEAIHLLALGRSFRTHLSHTVMTYHEAQLTCYGEIMDRGNKISLGIEKNRQGQTLCKIAGEHCARLSDYAATLPVQLITPETFSLLSEGPQIRRRFLDWGVFHVEQRFSNDCQRYLRLLKQRNALLKQTSQAKALSAWEHEFVLVGEKLSQARRDYLYQLFPFIHQDCQALLPTLSLRLDYEQGWEEGISFEDALHRAYGQDRRLGYTSVGPHRAEVAITLEGHPASLVLSRGQQKLLVCALHLAQARHLAAVKGKKCLYLIDDLASELDTDNRQRLLARLASQQHQVFCTGVDKGPWEGVCEQFGGEMFHVEQGEIKSSVRADSEFLFSL